MTRHVTHVPSIHCVAQVWESLQQSGQSSMQPRVQAKAACRPASFGQTAKSVVPSKALVEVQGGGDVGLLMHVTTRGGDGK